VKRFLPAPAAVAAVILAAGCPIRLRPPSPSPADNSFCYVCHVDFSAEELTVTHVRVSIGCDRCHGPSDDHMANEENIIPPDIMYERDKVNSLCSICHGGSLPSNHAEVKLVAPESSEICTECHGTHRVKDRRRRWDKTTRELLPTE